MIKTYCDICGKEATTEKHDLSYHTMYGTPTEDSFDICTECFRELVHLRANVEAAFIASQGDYTKTLEYLVTHNKYA